MCRAVADAKGDDEGDGDDVVRGEAPGGQGRAGEVLDRRLGEEADAEAGHGDAELGRGDVEVEVLEDLLGQPGPRAALVGELVDAGATDADEGELGRDEEAVDEHQHEEPDETDEVAHRRARSSREVGWGWEAPGRRS
jgi:hypothetical protein